MRSVDTIIVGASLSAAAAAKRLVDAGLETIVLERKELPRHKICSGILSPRGHRFLLENFGPLPREALHEPTACRGVTFHFPSMVSLSMDFFGGTTPHLHRKYSDYWAIKRSGAEIHDQTSFSALEDNGDHVLVHARKKGVPVEYRARQVIGADGPSSLVTQAPNVLSLSKDRLRANGAVTQCTPVMACIPMRSSLRSRHSLHSKVRAPASTGLWRRPGAAPSTAGAAAGSPLHCRCR